MTAVAQNVRTRMIIYTRRHAVTYGALLKISKTYLGNNKESSMQMQGYVDMYLPSYI